MRFKTPLEIPVLLPKEILLNTKGPLVEPSIEHYYESTVQINSFKGYSDWPYPDMKAIRVVEEKEGLMIGKKHLTLLTVKEIFEMVDKHVEKEKNEI